ncbi:MAG: hypothetical protein ACOX5Q_10550 [Bacillota bacterium]|jgi:hypothetical protein|nr:hypothetical protein [Candidatus Fermentithermobacillaceae bacterium]
MSATLQTWLSAFFTIAIYTLVLYKDNKVFRFAETVMIGITAANGIVLTYHNYIKPVVAVDIIQNHKYLQLIPIVLGLMMYTRFVKPIAWVSRIPMGFWVGVGAAYILVRNPGVFISQITASFLALNKLNNLIFVVGVIAVVVYFYFTVPIKSAPMKGATTLGKAFLLVSFGATFASTVMSRISLLLGRLQFLLQDWLRIAKV